MHIHVEIIGGEFLLTRGRGGSGPERGGAKIIVEVPLNIGLLRGAHAQAGDQRRKIARRGEEGDSREVQGRLQDAARTGRDSAAEGLIEEVFLRHTPTNPFSIAAARFGGMGSADSFAGILDGVGVFAGSTHDLGRVG